MQWVRMATALLLPCLLAACHSNTNQPKTMQSQTASGDWLDLKTYENQKITEPMKGAVVDATTELTHKLLTRCIDDTGPGRMNACVRERLLAGYDTTGAAKTHCPVEAEFEQQYMCIVLGGYVGEFIRTLDPQEAQPRIDWSDPERSMRASAMAFMTKSMTKCLGGASASDPTQCLLTAMAKQLGLGEADVEPCRVLTNDQDFGQCISEAYSVVFIRDGIARM